MALRFDVRRECGRSAHGAIVLAVRDDVEVRPALERGGRCRVMARGHAAVRATKPTSATPNRDGGLP